MHLTSASNVGLIENSVWQSNLTAVRFSATAFGDINNDGNLDLALSGCLSAGASDCDNGAISKIYINNGTTLIENQTWQQNLTGAGYGSLALGDIDNDGDLDLALSGCPSGTETSCNNIFSKIYINNGTTLTESSQWQNNLTGVYSGSITFSDINNDGKIDLGLIGYTGLTYITKIYINNGTTLTESSQWQNNLTGLRYSDLAFGDIDNDRDLDLSLVGRDFNSNNYIGLYINNGTSLVYDSVWSNELTPTQLGSIIFGDVDDDGDLDLAEIGIGDYLHTFRNDGTTFVKNQSNGPSENLAGVYEGSFAFADYNNDGDLDLIGTGYEQGRGYVYENDESQGYYFVIDNIAGNGVHTDDFTQNSLAWGDLDQDNDLDLIISGLSWGSSSLKSTIYISNASLTKNNTKPNPPNSSLSAVYTNNVLTLSWENGSDVETNTSGLYYNLMVGNSSNNDSIVSGVYGGSSGGGNAGGGADGYFGNMMQRKSITLNVPLEANKTYYWYVQTIDTGLAKSNWSTRQNFTTGLDTTKPNITIQNPSPNASLHTINPFFAFNLSVVDTNLSNVTLYANFNGTMLANETNSSGINGTYTFNRNLTGFSDGMYSWYIYACDSLSNCQTSEARSFYLDRTSPRVYLISPSNGASWTSSSTVTFSYNVTDTDIANCSLIINGAVDQTDDSITEDTAQTFTKSMSNGNYTWYVNCSDYVGYSNKSETRSLTVNYVVSDGDEGSDGGGGGSANPAFWTQTYVVNNGDFEKGYAKELSIRERLKINVTNEIHYIGIVNLTNTTATINISSKPIQIILTIGEEAKLNLTSSEFYDLLIRLNSIENDKANLSVRNIHEEIPEKESVTTDAEEKKEIAEKEARKEKLWLYGLIGIGVIVIGVVIVFLIWKRKNYSK